MQNQVNPVPRGKTFYTGNSSTLAAIPTTTAARALDAGQPLEGQIKVFQDVTATTSTGTAQLLRSGRDTVCMFVRNVSGINLLPGYAVTFASGYYGQRVDGYVCTDLQNFAGVVDDRLPAAGVADGDLFWITIAGPTLWISPLAGAGFNATTVAQGDLIYALTAATSQATTAGRWQDIPTTNTSQQATNGYMINVATSLFGRAMSAMTSGQTNTGLLVDLIKRI